MRKAGKEDRLCFPAIALPVLEPVVGRARVGVRMLIARCLVWGAAFALLAGCANRSEFVPEGDVTTVGMPAELSDRERQYVSEVDAILRREGYLPVRHGSGELGLAFRIAEGPGYARTKLELSEGWKVLAKGRGWAAGVPMVGRDRVAERSFRQAFGEFESALPGAAAARVSGGEAGGEDLYVY